MSDSRATRPEFDPLAPLQFIINAASGREDAQAKGAVIEAALAAAGRQGELRFCRPRDLPRVAGRLAAQAKALRTAVVAVGGDGTLNTVAQFAHTAGCAMGVVPQGTFNYFARTHGIPGEPAQAAHQLLQWRPWPVRVAAVNGRLFLVNASLGLYPDLLEDREHFKARFGRSRWVAMWAGALTLLRSRQHLRLRIEHGDTVRDVRALTLFVGNNRLQLESVGLGPAAQSDWPEGRVTAVMLKPVGAWTMLGLLWRGAMGSLGQAQDVERFEFEHLVVRPAAGLARRGVKVAFDGEVTRLGSPLDFCVQAKPLHLLMPAPCPDDGALPVAGVGEGRAVGAGTGPGHGGSGADS
jgi:diacylglycerol kinase family enzyme